MKRVFGILGRGAIAFVLVGVVLALMGLNNVPEKISSELSKKLKVNVSIGGIKPAKESITVTKIEMDNPPGQTLGQAFTCETMKLNAPISNYMDQDVVIDEITLDNVYFDLEFDKKRSKEGNWSSIMENVMGDKKDGPADPKDAKRTVLIKRLILTNIKTDLVYHSPKGDVQHLPPLDRLELNDLHSEGGPLVAQILKLVLGQSIKAVFQAQDLKHPLPGGHARYLLPLRRLREG